jgi:hypothetical protein
MIIENDKKSWKTDNHGNEIIMEKSHGKRITMENE